VSTASAARHSAGLPLGALPPARAVGALWARFLALSEAARAFTVFGGAAVILFARRPEALLRAELASEDGLVFYVGTYFGSALEILFRPYAGYQAFFVRIVAFVERLVPVEAAPLVANAVALAVFAALAAFVASSRMASVLPDVRHRVGLAVLLVLVPGGFENIGSMTNVQHLVPLYLLALSIARPPAGRLFLAVDLVVLGIASITGPYGALLQPLFWWRAWRRRDRYSVALAAILVVGSLVQLVTLVADGRRPGDFDEPVYVVLVFVYRLTLGGMVGQWTNASIGHTGFSPLVGIVATALVIASIAWVWWHAVPRWVGLRLLVVWTAISLPALLAQPHGSHLGHAFIGGRYFFVPVAILALALVVAVYAARHPAPRLVALALGAVLVFGAARDFRVMPIPGVEWAQRSGCIGGPEPCRVVVWPGSVWSIEWPGSGGEWVQPHPES